MRRTGSARFTRLISIPVLATALTVTAAVEQTEAERDARLEQVERAQQQRNVELEEKVRRLEAREAARVASERTAPRVASPPPTVVSAPAAKEVVPVMPPPLPTSRFNLELSGFIQTQVDAGDVSAFIGRFPLGPSNVFGAGGVNDRFLVRRARLSLFGDYAEQLEFRFEVELFSGADFNSVGGDIAARDLFVYWRPTSEFNLKVGQFKAPFGRELLTSDSRLISIEQSLPTTALTLER